MACVPAAKAGMMAADSGLFMHLSPPPPPFLLQRRRLLGLGASVAASLLLPAPAVAEMLLAAAQKKGAVPARKPKPPRLVMLDAGHGGRDPGAIGQGGTYEKDVTLDVARLLAASLDGQKNVLVKLTRDSDVFLPLASRVQRAREAKADLFISIHADSASDHKARGLSAYTLSEKGTDAFARELAKRENSVDEVGGVDLNTTEPDVAAILRELTARHTRNAALKAKRRIVGGVGREWQLLDNPMRAANFAVLRAPDVPSLLIETGFLSNTKDEALLRNKKHRQRIAALLAREVAGLLATPPFA